MNPDQWFGGAERVLFVHAHPDDETITTGGTLAALAAAGRDPALVTVTRGERGEVVPGPLQELQGTERLAPHRETELRSALAELGVERHAFLGAPPARAAGLAPRVYRDSGMTWGADGLAQAAPDAGAEALTAAAAVDPLSDLLALADAWDCGAIVSYNGIGGYGHPDHVLAHRLARSVAHGLELPFWEIAAEPGAEPDADPESSDPESSDSAGRDADAVERHDIGAWYAQKLAALRSHATQLVVESTECGEEIVHVGGQRQPIDRVEAFRRLA